MSIQVKMEGGKLVIECDVPVGELSPSKSGKTLVVATTGGFMKTGVKVGGKEVMLGFNAVVGAK